MTELVSIAQDATDTAVNTTVGSKVKFRNQLTAERLRELLDYDPTSGVFTRRVYARGGHYPGTAAGSVDVSRGQARVRLSVDGVYYVAHRLAWLHFYGGWPSGEVDHIDGNATRNAISNLRIAPSRSAQMHNYKIPSTNTSGYKGVKRHASKWVDKDGVTRSRMHFRADITLNRQKIFLGLYDTAEEAGRVYAEAALKYHGEYARFGNVVPTSGATEVAVPPGRRVRKSALGIAGVYRDTNGRKYRAQLWVNGKDKILGYYATPIAAWYALRDANNTYGKPLLQTEAEVRRLSDLEMSRRAAEQQQLPLIDAPPTAAAESVEHENV